MSIKGYKVFNPDWTCRDMQYGVGKTFKLDGNIEMCGKGFHFCQKASDCFEYYGFNSTNKVAEVEAIGLVETKEDKSVTDEIVILREISWQEVLTIVNEGKDCTGLRNTGDCNTGNWNTGDRNTGNWNTGDCNTGNWNTGDRNTGNWNTGDWNTGDRNTGNWNTGDWNTGFFSTLTPKCELFEKLTDLTHSQIQNLKGMEILRWNYEDNWWIYSENMSAAEKKKYPAHKATGGYLKTVGFKAACKMMWDKLDTDDKKSVLELPNFDAEIFKKVTGIEV